MDIEKGGKMENPHFYPILRVSIYLFDKDKNYLFNFSEQYLKEEEKILRRVRPHPAQFCSFQLASVLHSYRQFELNFVFFRHCVTRNTQSCMMSNVTREHLQDITQMQLCRHILKCLELVLFAIVRITFSGKDEKREFIL